MSRLAENLKRLREQAGYKDAKLFAKAIGMPYSTYFTYETGRSDPKATTLKRLAAALHVSTDELLGYEVPIVGEYEKYKGWLESGYGLRVGERFGEVFIWTGMPEDENEKGVPGYKVLRFVNKAAFCNFIEAVIESEKWQMRSRVASTLRMLIYKGDNISTAEVPTDILEKL